MAVVFEKPKALADIPLHYCPGCPHGIIHRLVADTPLSLSTRDHQWAPPPLSSLLRHLGWRAPPRAEPSRAQGSNPSFPLGAEIPLFDPLCSLV